VAQRIRRINEQLKEVLAVGVQDAKDPRLGFLTVTEVRTSPDLRHAEVFYTALPDDAEALARTAEGLRSATPMLRRLVSERLRMKYLPDLDFRHDPVPGQGRRIEQLLSEQAQRPRSEDG